MNQTQLTSFLVFSYLKQRQLQQHDNILRKQVHQSLRTSYQQLRNQQIKKNFGVNINLDKHKLSQSKPQKLIINMEYEEYQPEKMPSIKSKFYDYSNKSKNKYKSFYSPNKKNSPFNEDSVSIQKHKQCDKKISNSNSSQQKTKKILRKDIDTFKRMYDSSYQSAYSRKDQNKKNKKAFNNVNFMYNSIDQQKEKTPQNSTDFRGYSEMKRKIDSVNLSSQINQGNDSLIQKLSKNRQKKRINSKKIANIKFGLDIRQVKKISLSQHKKNSNENNKLKVISEINQGKGQEISDPFETLKPTIVLQYKNSTLESSSKKYYKQQMKPAQEKCMTEKAQMLNKLSKALSKQGSIKFRKNIFSTKDKKISDQRSVQNRLEKMYNAFSVILYSFACFTVIPQKQCSLKTKILKRKDDKFSYYVGNGNNKNLIRSIMRKRWWWVQTEDYMNANFVWTQLKIPAILQNQASMRFSSMQIANPENYRIDPQQHRFDLTKGFSLKSDSNFQNCKKQPQNRNKKVFHRQMKQKFYRKLPYQQQISSFLRQLKTPTVLHNHYQSNNMFGNKKALFKNITEYYSFLGKNAFQIIPLTFHVQKLNSKSWKLFQNYAKQKKNALWVVKPGENSNRGQGIFVSNSPAKIKAKIQSKKGKDNSRTYIIQKYIKNLFLFNRRKFDIRTYMLTVTIGGVQKFFWYQQGYLRTSSQIYDIQDFDDIQIHLTNDAVQCKNENYGKYQAGNKVSYHQFQRYLDANFSNTGFQVKQLNQKMKNIALQAVKSSYFKIDPAMKEQSFQIFGIDFIIDNKFNPWLIQINTNPCLQLSAPCLQRLIPRMLQNAFRLAVDPVYQPLTQCPRSFQCYIPENLIENNRFQLMFDSLFDRNFQWEKYSSQKSQKICYEDQDDVFDNDGQQINVDF